MDLKNFIRDVPDFPKSGIIFKDITPLLKSPKAFTEVIERFITSIESEGINVDAVAGLDARGFIFGGYLAGVLGKSFIPIRKKGKLPWKTKSVCYGLEYGSGELEIHEDAFEIGNSVLIVDDLLATGGTALAACELVESLGGKVAGCKFVIELEFLSGRILLERYKVESLIKY